MTKADMLRFITDNAEQQKELMEVAVESVRLVKRLGEAQAPELTKALKKAHFLPGGTPWP
jgi:hypothetical protein